MPHKELEAFLVEEEEGVGEREGERERVVGAMRRTRSVPIIVPSSLNLVNSVRSDQIRGDAGAVCGTGCAAQAGSEDRALGDMLRRSKPCHAPCCAAIVP